jgi:AcrR family transcriptional regulator
MDMQDRRVKRTQNLLAKALIVLTLEKGYEAVTIRDITERADVGYATFFRHYHDKDALLQDVLDVVLSELITLLLPSSSLSDPADVGTLLFTYVQEHSEIIRVLLSSRGSSLLMQRMIEAGTQSVLLQHASLPESPVPADIAAYLLVTSSIALIGWWLDHAMPYPPARMGIIYRELIARPTSAVALRALHKS